MAISSHFSDVAHVIQVAVAPVFLLSGIGAMLAVFIARIGRIVDRSRMLDERLALVIDSDKSLVRLELATLSRRTRMIDRAVALASAAGIFVCLVIITLFVDYLFGLDASVPVALFFLLAMCCFIAAFGNFLREVLVATAPLRREARP
jgi:hypothetical protein